MLIIAAERRPTTARPKGEREGRMNRQVRRRLEMAVRVRDFSRTHPSADASYASVLSRLEGAITRMEALAGQQQGGYLSKHSSTVRRKDLRRRLHGGLLRHLVTIAADAASENPALTEMFRLPAANATNKAFQTLARKMLEQGQAQKELLAKHGLADRLLDDLGAAVNEFDASLAETNGGKQDHVLARAELDALSDEVMRLVGMLDGLNRYRFERDRQLLVAWESARHVVTGPQAETEEKPETSTGPVQAGPGEVKPAA
jgi:hypothetical protein